MHILHYTLGFPPYRSGGLVKYANDLMQTQYELGHKVVALYPGGTSLLSKKCHIKENGRYGNIQIYEIVNPLPVPLMYGLKDVNSIVDENNIETCSLKNLLDNIRPDVVHLHTLMGFPLLFIKIIKERGIRIVFTSHDYYGLCIKVNFIDETGSVCKGTNPDKCKKCNYNAKSTLFLKLRNAKFIVPMKSIIRKIKK